MQICVLLNKHYFRFVHVLLQMLIVYFVSFFENLFIHTYVSCKPWFSSAMLWSHMDNWTYEVCLYPCLSASLSLSLSFSLSLARARYWLWHKKCQWDSVFMFMIKFLCGNRVFACYLLCYLLEVTWHGAWLYSGDKTRHKVSFTWHQLCNNRTAL